MVPEFEEGEFIIKDYEWIKEIHETVFSEVLVTNGLSWKLKVYPNGNGNAKKTYLSVFLEMVKGHKEQSKYEYRIDMIHPRDWELIVSWEYSSDFEVGECWGYNWFYRIEGIIEEGFIFEEDKSLRLKFFVWASNYS